MSWMASLSNSSFQELVNDIYYHLTGDILKAEGDITVIRLLEVLYDSRDIDAIRSILEMEEQISMKADYANKVKRLKNQKKLLKPLLNSKKRRRN